MKAKHEAPCGLCCLDCSEYEKSCKGKTCFEQKGEMFWGKCDLFECCVNKRRLKHCGLCDAFPCKLFISHNDPSLSKEEAKKENKRRQEVLRERLKTRGKN